MEKKELADIIKDEIDKWEKRIFFPNEKFKENTPADLILLKKKVVDSNMDDSILTIASETEACVYKIGRFIVEAGVKNKNITFLDGDIFLPYVDVESRYMWQSRKLIDEIVESISREISKKWVIIPEFNCAWNKELAIYFMSKVEALRPYGIIFYSNMNNADNLAQVLVEETYTRVFQFPMSRYKSKKEKRLAPDDY